MINNKLRVGNFTSSEIVALTKRDKKGGFGAPALTYIEETNMERRLNRSLTTEIDARPLTWGKLLEERVFELLGLEYALTSQETSQHPDIPFWAGSKDGIKHDEGKTIMDIKCPMTLKSFCQLVQPLYNGLTGMDAMNAIRENHKDGDKYYWQLVSNACIESAKCAELIVYVPYFSELTDIRMMAHNVSGDQSPKHYWIAMSNDDDLPYLLDGGYYRNVNVIRFEIPEADKQLLTDMVKKAGEMLLKTPGEIMPSPDKEANATVLHDANALIV
jgi:hypothetical protein